MRLRYPSRALVAVGSALALAMSIAPADAKPRHGRADPVGKPATMLVTQGVDGSAPDSGSRLGQVSAEGSVVVFSSRATNLAAGDTNRREDVFAWDRTTRSTARVSTSRRGGPANGASWQPRTSADGRYVVFTSVATDLAGGDRNGASDVFLHDRLTNSTRVVSHPRRKPGRTADGWSRDPWISADADKVVFRARARGLVGRDARGPRFYEYDVKSGKARLLRSPWRKPRLTGWIASPDGRYVGLTRTVPTGVRLQVWDRDNKWLSGSCTFEDGSSVSGELSADGRYFTGKVWQQGRGRTLLFAGSCDTRGIEPPVEVSGGLDATAAGGSVAYNYSPPAIEPVQDVSVVTRAGSSESAFLRPPRALWKGGDGRSPAVSVDDSARFVAYVSLSDTPIVAAAVGPQAIYLWDRSADSDVMRIGRQGDHIG